jgi:hypothetical protein
VLCAPRRRKIFAAFLSQQRGLLVDGAQFREKTTPALLSQPAPVARIDICEQHRPANLL